MITPLTKAMKGNQFWKARSRHGRDKIFATPADLWAACCEYFQWIDDNPLYAVETVKFQGDADLVEVPKMRAMTIQGLCIFLGVASDTWTKYRGYPEYTETCRAVQDIIYQQKFSGAAADLLNQNIIARELGLKDKKEHEHKGGATVATVTLDPEQYKAVRAEMLKEDDC